MVKGILSHSLALVIGAAVVLVGLNSLAWFKPDNPLSTLHRPPATPYVAPQSPIVTEVARAIESHEIVALKPTKREVAKIEKKLGGELPEGPVLSVSSVSKLPDGGTAVVSLGPQSNEPGAPEEVVLTIYPNKRKFFEFINSREFGVYSGLGFGNQSGRVWLAEFTQSVARTGPVIWEARAGYLSGPTGGDGYVLVGGKVRF